MEGPKPTNEMTEQLCGFRLIPVFPFRSGIPACFESAVCGALTRHEPCALLQATPWVLGGDARLAFHGVDRIMPGTSTLLPQGGRINLTLRRVTRPG